MATHLDISTSTSGPHHVVTATGEIDLASAPHLQAALADAGDAGSVVVDLSNVTFIDSTGLRVLISSHEAASQNGTNFSLIAVEGPVTRLLSITGVDGWLNVFDSVAAVVADA